MTTVSKTTFAVIDLEWNSALPGSKAPTRERDMMFEIIEIGAIRLSSRLDVTGAFHSNVRPVLYRRMHRHIAKLTGRTEESLRSGDRFPEVYRNMRSFVGDQAILASWGHSDPEVLKSNIEYFDLEKPTSWLALDLQQFFSAIAEDTLSKDQRSVEYALDFLNIPKDLPFHEAFSDARYAARIFQATLAPFKVSSNEENAVRYMKKIRPFLYDPWVNRQYTQTLTLEKKDEPLEILKKTAFTCPACDKKLKIVHKPLTSGWRIVKQRRTWFASGRCTTHGRCEILAKRNGTKEKSFLSIRVRIPR